jgi:hypothetical protein
MQTLLHQRRFLVNATTVTLRDPYHIVVRERAGLSVTHHTIPLDAINPNPIRIQDVRLAWAVASGLMICLTGAVLYGSFPASRPASPGWGSGSCWPGSSPASW